MKRDTVPVYLRMDPILYALLKEWASNESRSVNRHIEHLLRTTVDDWYKEQGWS